MTSDPKTPEIPDTEASDFRGYTLDEIKYRKAVTLLQREFTRAKIEDMVRKFTDRNSPMYTGTDKKKSLLAPGNVMGRIFKSLDYLDYALLGMSIFSTARKFFSLFRRRR